MNLVGYEDDWKEVYHNNDGCSSGIFKYIARFLLWFTPRKRNYKCICVQHDFDYRYGWKYGIGRDQADVDLLYGVTQSGHPKIAKIMFKFVRRYGEKHYKVGKDD